MSDEARARACIYPGCRDPLFVKGIHGHIEGSRPPVNPSHKNDKERLQELIKGLEIQLEELEKEHGDRLYIVRYSDNRLIAEPVVCALANAYAALVQKG